MSKYLLFRIILKVLKENAAFSYFLLESCEGVCFYSTIECSEDKIFRTIELLGSIDFLDEIKLIIESVKERYAIDVQSCEVLPDNVTFSDEGLK